MQCTQCGSHNAVDAKFCSQCGHRLGVDDPSASESTATIRFGGAHKEVEEHATLNEADAAAVEALPAGSALLVVLRGPGAGSRFLLDTDIVTAGRHPDSDIFLDDITVSRRHVEFRRENGGPGAGGTYTVHDVGSLNGTYLNRDRIDDARLTNGDEVRIGKFRLSYFANDADVAG